MIDYLETKIFNVGPHFGDNTHAGGQTSGVADNLALFLLESGFRFAASELQCNRQFRSPRGPSKCHEGTASNADVRKIGDHLSHSFHHQRLSCT